MSVELNHTIIYAKDREASARFMAEVFGLGEPAAFGPFLVLRTANGVSLAYDDRRGAVPGHYAFLVSEEEFDANFTRIKERGLQYWADPGHHQENVINDNGRGFYFEDPSGHPFCLVPRPAWAPPVASRR